MNKIAKQLVAIFVGLFFMVGAVVAQPGECPMGGFEPMPHMHHACDGAMDFTANSVCYIPEMGAFVVVDSIDCSVDVLLREESGVRRIGRFTTDVHVGRHDLKKILRPVSISVMGDKVIVLASSQKDSSFLAVLDLKGLEAEANDEMEPVAYVGFSTNSTAFKVNPMDDEILVVGMNAVGYDINVVNIEGGLEQISAATNFHYHVPKQAERIQESDPHGFGLAIVAICVVFIALICICFIMLGYGALIQKVTEKNENKGKEAKGNAPMAVSDGSSKVDGEVYAAIAAAIYAYEQDLHDEEDTVITIQKVERAWTPWNAKFYNMNQYFSNKK